MKTYIKGKFRKSIFESEKGYIIGLFKVKETNDENLNNYVDKIITFTGYFHELNTDDNYCMYGELINHPKYGEQFNVTEYERLMPTDEDGLITFLSSNLFKGVGEKLAKSIVDTLGNNVLEEIIKDENCLLLVPKMTSKKAHNIYETLMQYEESHQTIVYLTDLGFNMKEALDIYDKYKNKTVNTIENNPYVLVTEKIIPFPKVDEIREKLNIAENNPERIKACILYLVEKLIYKNGDTYLEYDEISDTLFNYLKIDLNFDDFDILLTDLVDENNLVVINDKYYLKDMYEAENNIINTFKQLNKHKVTINLKNEIKQLEKLNNIIYNENQKNAIISALSHNLTIITGGPGTGKTTIIKAICELYQNLNKLSYKEAIEEIALLAPTGRASKRMSESTNLPASTIHRFLKWNKETNEFNINEYNKTFQKLIIIDEVSMIDINLLNSLLLGLTKNIKLVLVGDHNQLPSVGPGNILKDLIESNKINTIYLNTLYRQDENSYITTLAHEIKENNLSEEFLETKGDYTFLKCHDIKNNLKNLCLQLIEKGYDYKRVQIMAPMYAGINGIDNLNKELQEIFNPKDNSKNEIKYGDIIFRENDKVLQLVNLPEENIYNGDIGVIKNIVKIDKKTFIYIDFDGNLVKYESKDLNKITHGFIISIHKSQGSEFEVVILPICTSYKRMLYRKLIYTGITRAKKKLILIGEPEAFVYAINNDNERERKTNLLDQLVNNI